MKLSKYCFTYKNAASPTLFNALTREELVVDDELFTALRNKSFNGLGVDIERELTESGILLDCDNEDELLDDSLFAPSATTHETLDITYALTFSCNMRCTYCVQRQTAVNDEANSHEDTIISGLSALMDIRAPKKVRMSFFGGEPLLEREKLLNISYALMRECSNRGADFSFGITTNGTLIKSSDMRLLRSLGLDEMDITIDGNQRLHDSRRIYHNGSGTFNDIIDNLMALGRSIPVNLIYNISGEDGEPDEFLEHISRMTDTVTLKSIRFKPYIEEKDKNACCFTDCHIDFYKQIVQKAKALCLPVDESFIIGPCAFFDDSSIAISPDAHIYPCTPFFGDGRFVLGELSDVHLLENKRLLIDNLPRRCKECAYVPICGGGCRFVSLRTLGDVAEATCEKRYFDSIFSPI